MIPQRFRGRRIIPGDSLLRTKYKRLNKQYRVTRANTRDPSHYFLTCKKVGKVLISKNRRIYLPLLYYINYRHSADMNMIDGMK